MTGQSSSPSFFQDLPPPPDFYAVDRALHAELKRRLSPANAVLMAPRFEAMGKATAEELPAVAEEAERDPPRHVPYDAWGRRIDDIRVSPAWTYLKDFSARHAVVATGYDKALGAEARMAQAVLLHLYSASSATAMCPLAMTDAAARVLIDLAPAALRDRLVPRLTSTDPKTFITSGQWMTERTGGSDVGGTSTLARLHEAGTAEGDVYGLSGVKWFTSATTSEMSLALGRIEEADGHTTAGSRGLSLFCVDVEKDPGGGYRGIQVNRLKDKLGTKALPTAELTLQGVHARRLGEPGQGVKSVSGMLNITRFYNAAAAASGMAQSVFRARAYAWKRTAFGTPLAGHPLHAHTLDDLEADAAGALALVMEVAALIGKVEVDAADDDDKRRLRALIPLAKLTTGKQVVSCVSECLECFGGAGYVEDTGMPRMLRDAQVLPIWEGTTNVLSLDVLRAEMKDRGFSAVIEQLVQKAAALSSTLPAAANLTLRDTVAQLARRAGELAAEGPRAVEVYARRLALTTGYCVEATLLADTAMAIGKDDCVKRYADFVRYRLGGLLA
ncbi:MAG: acyl-CoA dehydrogenase family protein [Deltaproteobacteria bacterium]|nr:acyl-CoA dehydrogenase family protein [Deltaproteobacteria bacterium]